MKLVNRSEIEDKYKWDLSSLFMSDQLWEETFSRVDSKKDKITNFKNTLKKPKELLRCFMYCDEVNVELENLYVYAKMKKDEDTAQSEYQAMCDRVEMLLVTINTISSYIMAEINTVYSEQELYDLCLKKDFADYSYTLSELARKKSIIKSEAEEKIISMVGMISDNFKTTFSMFDNADIEFKSIIDEDGKSAPMSHGNYSLYMQSADRLVRKRAFNAMFTPYKKHINTIAAIYNGNLKKDNFYAKVRGFNSALEYSMFSENISATVYTNLINAVHNAIPALNDYLKIRKRGLGLNILHCYDLYTPFTKGGGLKKNYEEAKQLVLDALKPMGEEYQGLLKKAFSDRWIDVYESKNKRSGAYSWGTYTSHPYVLLNYKKTTHDIFTIAHELGHSMHSYYSRANQPYAKAGYEIFLAEIASTVNEVLLLKHLISSTSDVGLKKYLLSYYIEMFRTTVFRQTMFAEFELVAHKLVENNQPITAEVLNNEYYKLNEFYYGKATKIDSLIRYEWARIPHFYNSYYVYKYATGLTSAVYIAEKILEGDKNIIEGYYEFLKAGGSMPPCDILKKAGVELEKQDAFNFAFDRFSEAVTKMDLLI